MRVPEVMREFVANAERRVEGMMVTLPATQRSAKLQLLEFMASLGMAQRIHDVTPRIVLLFLVSKDASATTIVHVEECEGLLGDKPARYRPAGCSCPSRAAAASVKKTIASLSTLFQSEGMTSRRRAVSPTLGVARPRCIASAARGLAAEGAVFLTAERTPAIS